MNLFKQEDFVYIDPGDLVVKFLRNSVNSSFMNVNGSTIPVEFSYQVPDDYNLLLLSATLAMYDNSNMLPNNFGTVAPLTNGIRIYLKGPNDTESIDLLDGQAIKTNGDLIMFQDRGRLGGNTDRSVSSTINFLQLTGSHLRLPARHKFAALVRDNLTPISQIYLLIRGLLIGRIKRP